MVTITNLDELTRAIKHLENRQKQDRIILQKQVSDTYANLKPTNFITYSFK